MSPAVRISPEENRITSESLCADLKLDPVGYRCYSPVVYWFISMVYPVEIRYDCRKRSGVFSLKEKM